MPVPSLRHPAAWPLAAWLLGAMLLTSGAHAGTFYLSTERMYAPGEQPQVRIEATGMRGLNLRLYRLNDPAAFFDQQSDLHRPSASASAPTPSSRGLLREGARRHSQKLLRQVRALFGEQGRDLLSEGFRSLHQEALEGRAQREVSDVHPPLRELPLLDAWRIPLSDAYGWVYESLPIPVAEAGAYLVEASGEGHVAYTVVLVSRLALVTRQSASQLLVWTLDPATGQPRPGARVRVLERGQVRGEVTSDTDGLARFDLGEVAEPVVYAQDGEHFALLDPRYFPATLPEPRVYLFTERPVYRPAQRVYFKGFARDVEDERYRLPQSAGKSTVQVAVIDPRGEIWRESEVPLSARGSFDGSIDLPREPVLGMWQMVVTLDGKRHGAQFQVLSYVKPEVRLDVQLDAPVLRAGDTLAGYIEGRYFFGAPYGGADVKITVTRTRFVVPWYVDSDYAWFFSESEYRNTRREIVSELVCKLDDEGRCPFSFQSGADGLDYTYVVEASALDPTGKTITGSGSATCTKGAFRVSVEPEARIRAPGTAQRLRVRVRDHAGRPVSTAVEVVVQAQHVAADGVDERVEILREVLTTDDAGEGALQIAPQRSGYYSVRASARDDAGIELVDETFVFVTEDAGEVPFAPAQLEIVTDRRSYFAGDRAQVLILTPGADAPVLFSVEGGELYRAEVLRATQHAVLVEVAIGARQSPNFYLTATTLFGGQLFQKERSVVVPPREQLLRVAVSPERDEVKPGEEIRFRVRVTDHQDEPVPDVEVALAVVDEAIFAISPEIAVPLEGFFYPRKRNAVRSFDSLSFPFFGAARALRERHTRFEGEPSAIAFGSMKVPLDDVRSVFRDTAGFFPALTTDARGEAEATLFLPDNLTAWRATARAMSPRSQVGMGIGRVRAKKPLQVRLALPAQLTEGDEGQGALVLQNLSGQPQRVTATLDFPLRQGVVPAAGPPAALEVPAETFPQEVTLAAGQALRLPFSFVARGQGRVRILASAAGQGLSDELEQVLAIAPWSRERRLSQSGSTSPDAPEVEHSFRLPPEVSLEEVALEVEAHASSLAAIRATLPYLVEYPWGCTEQTLSRYLPSLIVQGALRRLQREDRELADEVERALSAGEERLRALQHDDGSFGWWETDAPDVWMTSYVVDGLAQAKALGRAPPAALERAVGALEAMLSEAVLDPHARAFAVYALAQHGRAPAAMLDALLRASAAGELPADAMAYAGLAAHAAGRSNDVAALAEALAARAHREEQGAFFGGLVPDDAPSDGALPDRAPRGKRRAPAPAQHIDVGLHPTETSALVLRLLHASGAQDALARETERYLLSRYSEGSFGTTRQSALVIRALAERVQLPSEGSAQLTLRINDVEADSLAFEHVAAATDVLRWRSPQPPPSHALRVRITQEGGASLHHSVALRFPQKSATLPATSEGGLRLRRSYRKVEGASGAWRFAAPDAPVQSGDTLLVTLEVESRDAVDFAWVEDPRPAGLFAVEQDGGVQLEGHPLRREGVRREHRDTRTAFFLRRLPAGSTSLHYLARAGVPGTYRALPAKVESMYLPNTYEAQSSSDVMRVVAP